MESLGHTAIDDEPRLGTEEDELGQEDVERDEDDGQLDQDDADYDPEEDPDTGPPASGDGP